MSEEEKASAAVASVKADAADATPTDVSSATRLRFVLTVEGDGEAATIKAEAWKYAEDGTLVETGPVKERDADNIVVGLFDSGVFFQTTSLLMGRTMALASGDLLRAIHIDVMADQLGIKLPPIEISELSTPRGHLTDTATGESSAESIFADTIAKALAERE